MEETNKGIRSTRLWFASGLTILSFAVILLAMFFATEAIALQAIASMSLLITVTAGGYMGTKIAEHSKKIPNV